jgi:hypothetical protein
MLLGPYDELCDVIWLMLYSDTHIHHIRLTSDILNLFESVVFIFQPKGELHIIPVLIIPVDTGLLISNVQLRKNLSCVTYRIWVRSEAWTTDAGCINIQAYEGIAHNGNGDKRMKQCKTIADFDWVWLARRKKSTQRKTYDFATICDRSILWVFVLSNIKTPRLIGWLIFYLKINTFKLSFKQDLEENIFKHNTNKINSSVAISGGGNFH